MTDAIIKLEYAELQQLTFIPSQHDPRYRLTDDLKDPCVVKTPMEWHLYGSIGSSRLEEWQIFHAIATDKNGPWLVQPPVTLWDIHPHLSKPNSHMAAPSVVYETTDSDFPFHLTLQTEFLEPGGKILHLRSRDGQNYQDPHAILDSILTPDSFERGIYDPHFAVIKNEKYVSYSGAQRIELLHDRYLADPDIFLAKSISNTWEGPWRRLGKILSHDDIPHHNPRTHQEYEWGLEGSQLLELPNGLIMLIAVCFKPNETRGLRQRIFFAVARNVTGPYRTLGIAIEPSTTHTWNSGENGHAMAEMYNVGQANATLRLWHQGRPHPGAGQHWSHRYADFPLSHVLALATQALHSQ